MRTEPGERLDPRAKTLWRVVGAVWALVFLVLAGVCTWALRTLLETSWLVAALPPVVAVMLAIVLVGLAPELRWRRWRYEIRDTEVDLQRGIVYVTRTLVPLARVQHVDTQQGPLERTVGLATVIFHTAAGPNKIPALAVPVAAHARDRIAELTQTADEI